MKKVLRAAVILLCLAGMFALTGCGGCDMNFNDRSAVMYYAPHSDENFYYYNLSSTYSGNEYIRVDKVTGESGFFFNDSGVDGFIPNVPFEATEPEVWEREEGDVTYQHEVPDPPVIVDGINNGWRGRVRVSKENYPIVTNLTNKYQTKGVEFIHINLLDGEGFAYGFVNVYDHSTGMLFSGGVAGVSGISCGVFIKYDYSTGEVQELLRIEGGCIMAFDCDTVLFFKGEKYYSQNMGEQPRYVCDDLAYDRGATSYSFVNTLFNGQHFVLYMHSDDGKNVNDYAYIIGADGNLISHCGAIVD